MSDTLTKTGFQIIMDVAVPGAEPDLQLQPPVFDTYADAERRAKSAQRGLRDLWGRLTIEFPIFIRDNATGDETEVPW